MIVAIVAIIVIILIAGVSAFSYIQSNNTIASYKQEIAVQTSSIGSLKVEVSSASSDISSQNGKISTQNSEISSGNNIASSQSSELASQISRISVLTGQVANLQSIINLTISQAEVISQTYTTGSRGNTTIDSFDVNYAGYILVSMSTASDYSKEGINLVNEYSPSLNSPHYSEIVMPGLGLFYPFTTATDAFLIPVVPGTVTVYLGTSDTTAQSATLSITYYY